MNTLHTPFLRRLVCVTGLGLAAVLLPGCRSAGDKGWVETVGPRWPTAGSSRQELPTPPIAPAKSASQPAADPASNPNAGGGAELARELLAPSTPPSAASAP